jgi:hypothetical protein
VPAGDRPATTDLGVGSRSTTSSDRLDPSGAAGVAQLEHPVDDRRHRRVGTSTTQLASPRSSRRRNAPVRVVSSAGASSTITVRRSGSGVAVRAPRVSARAAPSSAATTRSASVRQPVVHAQPIGVGSSRRAVPSRRVRRSPPAARRSTGTAHRRSSATTEECDDQRRFEREGHGRRHRAVRTRSSVTMQSGVQRPRSSVSIGGTNLRGPAPIVAHSASPTPASSRPQTGSVAPWINASASTTLRWRERCSLSASRRERGCSARSNSTSACSMRHFALDARSRRATSAPTAQVASDAMRSDGSEQRRTAAGRAPPPTVRRRLLRPGADQRGERRCSVGRRVVPARGARWVSRVARRRSVTRRTTRAPRITIGRHDAAV